MNHGQKRKFLIDFLLNEQPRYQRIVMPEKSEEQRQLLRSLMNVRMAQDIIK